MHSHKTTYEFHTNFLFFQYVIVKINGEYPLKNASSSMGTLFSSHQAIKDVSLVDVNSDQCLILGTLHRFQVSCGLIDEQVK